MLVSLGRSRVVLASTQETNEGGKRIHSKKPRPSWTRGEYERGAIYLLGLADQDVPFVDGEITTGMQGSLQSAAGAVQTNFDRGEGEIQ